MYSITKILTGGAIALLVCVGEAALFAADTSAAELPNSVTVHYADLNLNQPADAAKLYHRIAVAAGSTCGQRELVGTHFVSPAYERCVTDAIAQAVARVDRPALSAYHQQRVGLAPRRDSKIAQR
jgi:UrcA family protein